MPVDTADKAALVQELKLLIEANEPEQILPVIVRFCDARLRLTSGMEFERWLGLKNALLLAEKDLAEFGLKPAPAAAVDEAAKPA
jgi:hypothetical protein